METNLVQHELLDESGEKVGKITDVIPEPKTLEPAWYTVKTGMLSRERLVPAQAVEPVDGHAVVHCSKEMIKQAPTADDHSAPTAEESEELYRYYGIDA